jgi:hypothetical protein
VTSQRLTKITKTDNEDMPHRASLRQAIWSGRKKRGMNDDAGLRQNLIRARIKTA